MSARDLGRLIDQWAICREYQDLVEYRHSLAMGAAEYLTAPKVKMLDEQRRIVRVDNAPQEARRNPPRMLSHHWIDAYHRSTTEAVGKFHGQPSPRDLDYVLFHTKGGDNLLALVADEAEPSVTVRRFTGSRSDLLAVFD